MGLIKAGILAGGAYYAVKAISDHKKSKSSPSPPPPSQSQYQSPPNYTTHPNQSSYSQQPQQSQYYGNGANRDSFSSVAHAHTGPQEGKREVRREEGEWEAYDAGKWEKGGKF